MPDEVLAWPGTALPRDVTADLDAIAISQAALRTGLLRDEAEMRLVTSYLLAGVPAEVPLTVGWKQKRGASTTVVMRAVGRRPRDGIEIVRTFTRDRSGRWRVEHTLFVMADRHRGGAARRMMRASVEIYDRIGVERIDVFADIDVGGYVWAKLGFAATDTDDVRTALADVARRKPDLDLFTEANRIAGTSSDDELMYNLARLTIGDDRSCGKHLLAGSRWYGHATLTDGRHRARIARHFTTEPDETPLSPAGDDVERA